MTENNPTFFRRIVLAVVSFFRILANANFASKVMSLDAPHANERARRPESEPLMPVRVERDLRPALQLLSLLQREGRLVDFVQQDILSFSDADVGADSEKCKGLDVRPFFVRRKKPPNFGDERL